jgi:hypothetical protein
MPDEPRDVPIDRRFGTAWVIFAFAFAFHFLDEAAHNFLSVYNPAIRRIRDRLPFVPLPMFSFKTWITLLIAGFVLLLCLAPVAFRGSAWLRLVSRPVAILAGVFNALLHLGSSAYLHRWMPGVYSSPLLLAAALYLLAASGGIRLRQGTPG